MTKQRIAIAGAAIGLVLLVLGLLAGRYWFPSQPEPGASPTVESVADTKAPDKKPTIWTCSMHPQIRQDHPGKCPICGMDLIPLAEAEAEEGPRVLSMSESARALAEIQTSVVKREFPTARISLVGKLDYDQTLEKSLTARFPARIDQLYVNYDGIRVAKGEHLALVYSPELLTAQRELLTAYNNNADSSLTDAAREKLRLWDLLPDQIDAIIKSGEALDHFVLRAPIGGVVVSKNVQEGDYIKTGEPLFRIVDLSHLWLLLDAYESDLTWLRYGQEVTFSVETYPGETFSGKIAFIAPEVNRQTRTVDVRVNVPNPDNRLKPGMFAKGIVEARMAAGGKVFAPDLSGKWICPMHPEIVKDGPGTCDICGMDLVPAEQLGFVDKIPKIAPLVIPASAVLQTGKRAVVYVEVPNRENPTYEGREILLGPRAGDEFIVQAGLEDGDRVVTHGAFKIDSALQIQAKPSMMEPTEDRPSSEQQQALEMNMDETSSPAPADPGVLSIPADQVVSLVPPYLSLQAALAGDNLEDARAALKSMMQVTGHSGPVADLLHRMLAADTLDGIRLPWFKNLSNAMIAAARAHPQDLPESLLLMHCPMADGGVGADWLQASKPLQNPYYGAAMLTCGDVTATIGSTSQDK